MKKIVTLCSLLFFFTCFVKTGITAEHDLNRVISDAIQADGKFALGTLFDVYDLRTQELSLTNKKHDR